MEVSNFKQWRPELSKRFHHANSIPAFIYLHGSGAPIRQVHGPPTQVSGGDSIISNISNITNLMGLQSRTSLMESHRQGSNTQRGGVSGGGAGRGGAGG